MSKFPAASYLLASSGEFELNWCSCLSFILSKLISAFICTTVLLSPYLFSTFKEGEIQKVRCRLLAADFAFLLYLCFVPQLFSHKFNHTGSQGELGKKWRSLNSHLAALHCRAVHMNLD